MELNDKNRFNPTIIKRCISAKNRMYKYLFLLMISVSCTQSFSLQEFDEEGWKNDKKGCNGNRLEMINSLINSKDVLLNKSDFQISQALGKPDKQELLERSQKFFIYYISPASTCESFDQSSNSSIYLQIRFNALLKSNEVLVVEK